MIGYSLYTGLVGVENLSVIAVIDIAALLFTFSIMSNVLVLIEDGKKVSVIEIVQNAFKTPAFLAVILGILASVSGLMNGFMLSPAGVIWTTMKDMITDIENAIYIADKRMYREKEEKSVLKQ